jgi:hypothetical protein
MPVTRATHDGTYGRSLVPYSDVMSLVLRIWASEDGESHFEDVDLAFTQSDFVPPAPPVLLTTPEPASGYIIERVPAGWHGDWHTAPGRVLAVYLAGEGDMKSSDGEVRRLEPGTILLAEDTTGKGHITRVTGTEEMVVVIITRPAATHIINQALMCASKLPCLHSDDLPDTPIRTACAVSSANSYRSRWVPWESNPQPSG